MHGRPLLLLSLPLVLLGTGCTSAVRAVPFDGADSRVCRELADRWPSTVADQPQREVAIESDTVAAWGDPPIIARCGAPVPGPTTDQCHDVDGIDWVSTPLEDGAVVRFTTYGRDPAIEVLVPRDYEPQVLLMPAFGPTASVIEQDLGRCS